MYIFKIKNILFLEPKNYLTILLINVNGFKMIIMKMWVWQANLRYRKLGRALSVSLS